MTNSTDKCNNGFIAGLSTDILIAMLANPQIKPDDPNVADFAVSQAVALDKSLTEYFDSLN